MTKIFKYTIIRFIIVGILNTFSGLLFIYTAKFALKANDLLSNIIGYAVGFFISFNLNKNWTFIYKLDDNFSVFIRFIAVNLVAYIFNLATVFIAIDIVHINSYLAQALGIPVFTIFNYILSRAYVFPKEKCRDEYSFNFNKIFK